MMATLILSQGVPMMLAGDELGRTQQGNNNAYCQDNEISWVDWELAPADEDLLRFTQAMIRLFHQHPVLRRRRFFQGRKILKSEVKDITWFTPNGEEMTDAQWHEPELRTIAMQLAGNAINDVDDRGHPIVDNTMLIVLNAFHEEVKFRLPSLPAGEVWRLLIDTRNSRGAPARRRYCRSGQRFIATSRSLVVMRAEERVEALTHQRRAKTARAAHRPATVKKKAGVTK
jgi:glycogen operon protein